MASALETLRRSEAVQLFVERAAAIKPGFDLNEHNAPAVAQICQRLDGIPLALELAAARVGMLTPEQIAARLDDRFRLLTGGSRTALPRQQTLRSLIDWSYDLLSEPERLLFCQLSVFVGGWSLEAAEAVCPDLDVLELLAQLVKKSLVVAEEGEDQAATRFRLLETIRQYARDQLLETGAVERGARSPPGLLPEVRRGRGIQFLWPAIAWNGSTSASSSTTTFAPRCSGDWNTTSRPPCGWVGHWLQFWSTRGFTM